jgi:hypothetical protein
MLCSSACDSRNGKFGYRSFWCAGLETGETEDGQELYLLELAGACNPPPKRNTLCLPTLSFLDRRKVTSAPRAIVAGGFIGP